MASETVIVHMSEEDKAKNDGLRALAERALGGRHGKFLVEGPQPDAASALMNQVLRGTADEAPVVKKPMPPASQDVLNSRMNRLLRGFGFTDAPEETPEEPDTTEEAPDGQ